MPLLNLIKTKRLWNCYFCVHVHGSPALNLQQWLWEDREQRAYIQECLGLKLMPTVSVQRDSCSIPTLLLLLDMFHTVRQTLTSPIPFHNLIASLASLCWAWYQRILLMGNADPATSGILTTSSLLSGGGKGRILCEAYNHGTNQLL